MSIYEMNMHGTSWPISQSTNVGSSLGNTCLSHFGSLLENIGANSSPLPLSRMNTILIFSRDDTTSHVHHTPLAWTRGSSNAQYIGLVLSRTIGLSPGIFTSGKATLGISGIHIECTLVFPCKLSCNPTPYSSTISIQWCMIIDTHKYQSSFTYTRILCLNTLS